MSQRPSRRELAGVWSVGIAGELLAYDVVEDAGAVIAPSDVAAGVLFFVTPLFLVAYSLIWAWPLVKSGERRVVVALLAFGAVVEISSIGLSAATAPITNRGFAIRLVAVLSPAILVGYGLVALWARRAARTAAREPGKAFGRSATAAILATVPLSTLGGGEVTAGKDPQARIHHTLHDDQARRDRTVQGPGRVGFPWSSSVSTPGRSGSQ